MAGWDLVQADLLTYLPTLTGLSASTVFDGPAVTKDSLTAFAEVGDDGTGNAGFFQQEDIDVDALVTEEGEVTCRLVAQGGATDLATLRATAKAWLNSLRTKYRADKTLSGALKQGSVVAVGRTDIRQIQNSDGAAVELIVAVRYLTRL